MDSLDDMRRAKRHVDARLDSFEEKLVDIGNDISLMNCNISANRERIEDIELHLDEDKQDGDDFIDVVSADCKESKKDVKDEHMQG